MNRAGDEFLSRSGFTQNEHGTIRGGDLLDRLPNSLHGLTFAREQAEIAFGLRFVAQVNGFHAKSVDFLNARFEFGNPLVSLATTRTVRFLHADMVATIG